MFCLRDNKLLEAILAIVGVLMPMVLWFYSYVIYRRYYTRKIDQNEKLKNEIFGDEGGGMVIGDGLSMRPPLPIEDNSINQEIQILVKRYNKIVKVFWLWSIFGSAIIIIFANVFIYNNW